MLIPENRPNPATNDESTNNQPSPERRSALEAPLPECGFAVHELPVRGARLRVSTYGGQTLEWLVTNRKGEVQAVHFMSPNADLSGAGNPIRGGGQLAGWPNFGSGRLGNPPISVDERAKLPDHGLLRARLFEVVGEGVMSTDRECLENSITLEARSTDADLDRWPYRFSCRHSIIHSRRVEDGSFLLTNSLTYKNESDRSAPVQGLFHNYFALSSARDIAIVGPEDRTYIDLSDNDTEKLETSSPDKMIDGERFVGRVFQGMSMARIVDPTLGRVITIRGGLPSQPAREGEYDAVVWNPGRWEVADLDPKTWKYPFLHPDASMGMMCLEMGRLGSAVLQPGEEVTISQHVKVQFFGGIE